MRLSDAGVRLHRTKALYLKHRNPPCLTEDAARDRSNRLLEADRSDDALLRSWNCRHQFWNQCDKICDSVRLRTQ